jgi:hypothetical protein
MQAAWAQVKVARDTQAVIAGLAHRAYSPLKFSRCATRRCGASFTQSGVEAGVRAYEKAVGRKMAVRGLQDLLPAIFGPGWRRRDDRPRDLDMEAVVNVVGKFRELLGSGCVNDSAKKLRN